VHPGPAELLPRAFFDRPSAEVGPDLLGCVVWSAGAAGRVAIRLVEVEAYAGAADPASHAFRGRTARNAVMFGPPGHAYVYFTYGMHYCVNLVCQPAGQASAVLLRAGQVIEGTELAAARRHGGTRERDLARGPARLCQALGIDRALDGTDVCSPGSPLRVGPARGAAGVISSGPRVGISRAADWPLRFWLAGDGHVSPYRRAAER
jgi:DNA-3-methyladenine glycosylase